MSTIELSNLLLHVYWPRKPNIYCTLHTNEVEGIYSAKISLFKKKLPHPLGGPQHKKNWSF